MSDAPSPSRAPERDIKSSHRSRRLAIIVSLSVLLLCGVGVAVLALTADSRPGGDLSGNGLRSLETIRSAVPAGASDASVQTIAATWMDACANDPSSHAGWVQDRVSVRFTDTAPPGRVKAAIDEALAAQGWVRHDIVIARGQGPTAHWSRPEGGGRRADAFAFPAPPRSSAWFVTATWQPPGPIVNMGNCA
jgi:hypothetical protein